MHSVNLEQIIIIMNKQVSILEGLKSFINSSLHKTFLLFISLSLTTSLWSADASITFSAKYSSNTVVDETPITIVDGITATFNKRSGGTATQYYTNGSAIRWYGGGTLTITSTVGNISAITISYTRTDNSISVDEGTWSTPNWTGDAASIVFTQDGTSGHLRISAIDVTYSGGSTKTLESIAVQTAPTKVTYFEGETFDPAGLVITRNYNTGDPDTYTYGGHESDFSFSPSTSTPLTTSNTSITITYGGKSTTQSITVSAAPTYTVTWMANGSQFGSAQTDVAGTALTNPGTPASSICDGSKVFVGWTADGTYADPSDAPDDLFTSFSGKTIPIGGTTYYAVFAKAESGAGTSVSDTLTYDMIGVTGTSYVDWSNKSHHSDAKYAGMTAGGNNAIQLRSNNNNSGIVTTTSGGKATKIEVVWNSNTSAERTTNIYGSNSAYESAADLYNSSKQGTLLGTCVEGTSTELTIDDEYEYIGIRSASGALYLDTIIIFWGGGVSYSEYTISCGPSVSITPNSLTAERPNTGTANVIATANLFTPASWTWGTSDPSVATVSGNDASATVTYNGSGTCTISCTGTQGSTSATGYCTVTVPQSFTITLVDNGTSTDVTNRVAGEVYTLPFGTSSCPDYTFLGWVTSNYTDGTATAPTGIVKGEQTLTEATTYYAVYSFEDKETKSYSPIDDPSLLVEGAHIAIYGNNPKLKFKTGGTAEAYTETITTSTVLTSIPLDELWTVKLTGYDDYPHALYNGSQYVSAASVAKNALVTLSDEVDMWNIRTSTATVSGTMQIAYTSSLDFELYNGMAQLYDRNASATQNWILLEKYATTYTQQPSCGPTIKAEGEPYITSANGLTIQAVDSIDVKGTMLTGASTLYATSDNIKFTTTLKSNTITDGKITTKLAIKYTPNSANVADETATITLKDDRDLASTTITVHGRSLPESFVIVAKDASDTWRAVPANMPEASTYTGIPTDVDSDSDPASADRTAINTHYSLSTACTTPATGASHSRYDSVPWTVRFVGDEGKCLYGAKSGNQIYNGVNVSTAKQPYEWILLTNDNETYFIKSNNNANDRSLCMNTSNQIGLYATGNKEFRILPYTERCYYFAQPVNMGAASIKSESVKILLDSIPYAKQYQYKVNDAASWETLQLSEIEFVNPSGSKQVRVPVSGLTRGVQNTILIRGTDTSVDDADLCAPNPGVEYQVTTTQCDYVVNLGTPYPSSTTATISWTMDGFTCNNFIIRLYSDETCTTQVGSDITATKSPHVVTGLTESKQYYYRVYAAETGVDAPGCPSAIGEFMTKNPNVEIMTWHPQQVDVAVNISGTPVIMLYDEVQHGNEGSGKIADEIFFSKYFEASYNVKLLGIFNGTPDTVDLSGYQLWATTGDATYADWSKKENFNQLIVKSGPTDKLPMQLAPGKELIIYSQQRPDYAGDVSILNCAKESPKSGFANYYRVEWSTKNNLAFNGDDAIALYRIADSRIIDLIGAGDASGKNGSAKKSMSWNDSPGGWGTNYGTDTLGNKDYPLSTNRCLLIRKNIVFSGYNSTNQGANNAVDLNTSDFVTLGDHDGIEGEWFGEQIPNVDAEGHDDHGVAASCAGFEWVGSYNYTDYYKAFELKVDSTRLDTVGINDDGTYRIPVDTLYKMSCSKLKVQVFANSGDKKPAAENIYTVPIIVYEKNTNTNDVIFTKHGNKVCKECDVIVRDGKTLSSATAGVDSLGHITIYEGSKLDLTNKKLNAASLTLRARQDEVSSAYIPNNTQLADVNGDGGQPNVYFEKYISDEDWHWITVPYPVNVAEITFTDNTSCVYRTDYWIKWYDGEARADNPSQADGRNWKHLDPSTTPQLLPGVGYIVAIADQKTVTGKNGSKRQWKALRFPMAGYDETSPKNVAVKAYGAGSDYAELKPNNKGWNLVGDPYLSYYNGFNAATPLQTGKLEVFYDSEGLPYYDYDPETTSLYYVTIPQNGGKSEYSQELVTATELPPFTSYFVQIAGAVKNEEKSVMFNNSGRKTMIQQRYTDDEEKEEAPVFVGIQLSNSKNEIDNTGLCIHNQYAQGVYEVGADLYKWKGTKFTEYTKPVCFSMSEAGEMAFNALSEAEAARTNAVPLSCYTLMDGQYSFKLNEAYDLSRVESVILYDAQSNIYTDITQNSYEFNSTASTEAIKDRFYVSVTIRKEPSITTSFGKQTIGNNKVIKFVTPDGHLHIARDGVIYDIHGRIEQIVK